MKFSERKELLEGLEGLLEFYRNNWDVPCPYRISIMENIREYDENGDYDNEAVKAKMAKLARKLKPVEKRYDSGDDFNLIKKFSKIVKLQYYCKRDAVCTKVVTGTKEVDEYIYPQPIKTGHKKIEEIVEWQCDPLLG